MSEYDDFSQLFDGRVRMRTAAEHLQRAARCYECADELMHSALLPTSAAASYTACAADDSQLRSVDPVSSVSPPLSPPHTTRGGRKIGFVVSRSRPVARNSARSSADHPPRVQGPPVVADGDRSSRGEPRR